MTIHVENDAIPEVLRRALGAQYEVFGLIGRGGMGSVYRARETFLERDVAVKVLPAEFASGDARERFLREARTAARLSHPNIVPLHTFGQAGELLYYVMTYVEGESLETRLRREGRLPADDACRITSEIADALHHAHQLGVVHRDVKPDNVLLERATGRAMLTDFGVAKQRTSVETLTQTGVIVGTPHYMSPEQASGERDIDGRSDIYSLGVIAYRMTTGRLPFEGADLRDVLAQHVTRTPVAPAELVPAMSPTLEGVITRALAKDPRDRWPNARAMRDALAVDAEEGLPDSLRSISGMGERIALMSAALGEAGFLTAVFSSDRGLPWALGGAAVLVSLLGLLGLIGPSRRHGFRVAWQHFVRQPSWWTTWYPRVGRRPGDVWDRLPRDIRVIRWLNGTGMIANLLMLHGLAYGWGRELLAAGLFEGMATAGTAVVGAWLATFIPLWRRFAKRAQRLGLSRMEREQACFGPAWGPTWERPHVAALLGDAVAERAEPFSVAPADLAAQIRAFATDRSSPHAEVFQEAAVAAASLHEAIVALDVEIAQLARDSDPRERERIEESLAALGARDPGESAAKAEMRDLLERQVLLVRGLVAQREQLASRRDHLVAQLRTLALQLAHLRSAQSPAAVTEITGRVRALCRELDYRIAGVREVNALAP